MIRKKMNILKNLFTNEEVNTSRQIEFDIAKAVCIIFMIIIHCAEQLCDATIIENGSIYYILVVVLDAIFGAGTFMSCMGLGIAYGKKVEPDKLICRGCVLLLAGFVLNIFRSTIPYFIDVIAGVEEWSITSMISYTLENDILQFAGLALMLFGLLKKLNFSDLMIFIISLGMSIVGTLIRFIDFGNIIVNQVIGFFIGTINIQTNAINSNFSLFNWFIIVVLGYLYAKKLRYCSDINRYYKIALPLSAIFLAIYMIIAIPNRIGMMNGDLKYFYIFSTPNAIILFLGMVFVTSLYHFIGKLFNNNIISIVINISNNLTAIYVFQWIIIGFLELIIVDLCKYKITNEITFVIIGIVVNIISIMLGKYTSKWFRKTLG